MTLAKKYKNQKAKNAIQYIEVFCKIKTFSRLVNSKSIFCEISPLFYISSIDYQRGDQRCPKSMVYNSGKAIFNFLLFSTISNFCPGAKSNQCNLLAGKQLHVVMCLWCEHAFSTPFHESKDGFTCLLKIVAIMSAC